jgi:quinoprotein glucose dehydrogenase
MRRTLLILSALGLAVAIVGAQRMTPNGEWRYYAGDASSTKYSPLDQVTRANVRGLQVAWHWNSPDNEIVKANPASRRARSRHTVDGERRFYTETSPARSSPIRPQGERCAVRPEGEGRTPPNLIHPPWSKVLATHGEGIIRGTHDAHLVSIDAETASSIRRSARAGASM